MNHLEIIQSTREALNLSHAEVAAYIGINTAWYRDLETHEDELLTTLDLSQVTRLCHLLQITPRHLLACPKSVPFRQPEELKNFIVDFCQEHEYSPELFEEKAGWEVSSFLADPQCGFQSWSLDGLKNVCSILGVNYLEFLPD